MVDLISQWKTADLLLKMMRGDFQKITPYPFLPEKRAYVPAPGRWPLPRATPEQEGVRSSHLESFLQALSGCGEIQVHSAMVLRRGKVIAEACWKPYTEDYPQMVYSLSKSVTGMAVGIAVSEGLFTLDDRLVDLFPEKLLPLRSQKLNSLRVRHLLDMSSGIKFNELGSVVERDWVKAYLQSDCAFEPGSEFAYNSLNSYLLSAIICKKSGMGLVEYLTPRLFGPLGIGEVFWEKCPAGIEKGGWGMYLRLEDMAKLGQLYLQKGRWTVGGKTRQLVPRGWIEESVQVRHTTMMGEHKAGYGYQLWDFPIPGAYHFNGVFGQYVVVIPEKEMVIALTSGSQSLFIDASAGIIKDYFGGSQQAVSEKPFPANPRALRRLQKTEDSFRLFPQKAAPQDGLQKIKAVWGKFLCKQPEQKLPQALEELDRKTYRMEKSFGSLMPFILQGVHNNFCGGVEEFGFRFAGSFCTVTVKEGADVNHIRAGLDGMPRYSTLTINGEDYEAGSTAELRTDEDGRTVIKLFISFIETPHTRLMKFVFYNDRVIVRFRESPSLEAAVDLLYDLVGGNENNLEKTVMDAVKQQKIGGRVAQIIKPRAKGKLEE